MSEPLVAAFLLNRMRIAVSDSLSIQKAVDPLGMVPTVLEVVVTVAAGMVLGAWRGFRLVGGSQFFVDAIHKALGVTQDGAGELPPCESDSDVDFARASRVEVAHVLHFLPLVAPQGVLCRIFRETQDRLPRRSLKAISLTDFSAFRLRLGRGLHWKEEAAVREALQAEPWEPYREEAS